MTLFLAQLCKGIARRKLFAVVCRKLNGASRGICRRRDG